MRTHSHPVLPLVAVVVTALIITFALSQGVVARTTFQSSPVSPVAGSSPTVVPATPTVIAVPTVSAPQTGAGNVPSPAPQPPTVEPPPVNVAPAPTVPGFLPAPTIVNPNDLQSLPLAQPATTNPSGEPEPTPVVAANNNRVLRTLLDVLNFVWLVCGIVLLVGGAAVIIIIMRRSGRL